MTNVNPPRVLVTGAAGYIGRHVVTSLLDRGARVTAAVRDGKQALVDVRADVVVSDVLGAATDASALLGDADTVIHLAWRDGFVHNAQSHMLDLSAHFSLLSRLSHAGAQRISVLGTMHEVGYWEGAIDGDTPCVPRSLYGVAKDALRRSLFLDSSITAEIRWLRCFYIYGDDRRNQSIFSKLLAAVDEGKTSFPFTSGKNKYDFIRVEELGQQIAAASLAKGPVGVVNCCSGRPASLGEVVESFIEDNGLPISLEYGAFPDRPYDSPAVWGDDREIRAILAGDR